MLSAQSEVLTTALTALIIGAPWTATYIESVNGDQTVALPHERVSRREALQASAAGAVGLTALVLPRAASASSVGVSSESTVAATTTTIASVESLSIHLDAGNVSSYAGSGSAWNDLGGSGNYGAIDASVSFVSAAGGTPAHFSFGGSGSVTVTKANGSLDMTGPSPTEYTKLIWFRRDIVTGRFDNIFSSSTGSQAQHFLFFQSGGASPYKRLTTGHNSSFTRLAAGVDVDAGVWTFGAVTFSTAAGFEIYCNQNDRDWAGSGLIASSAYSAGTDALSGSLGFQLGGYAGLHRLAGDIATALVYDRALSAAEVKSYYANTVGRFYPAG